MIEILQKKVEMPSTEKRKFRRTCNRGNIDSWWFIYEEGSEDKILSKGTFEDMTFRCYYMNKNYYNENKIQR